jgi:hypothetical protein
MTQADSAACRGAADFPTGRRPNLTVVPDEGLIPGALFFWLNLSRKFEAEDLWMDQPGRVNVCTKLRQAGHCIGVLKRHQRYGIDTLR